MARYQTEYRSEYVYGNTALRREPVREENDQESLREQARRRSELRTRNRRQALNMDLPYLLILTVAAAAALVICCNYLKVQSSITAKIKAIETQESILAEMKNENDAMETRIHTYVNLDNVYAVATQELGMVYANRDQVITYDKTEGEYVRQYEDIPKQ